MRQLIICEGTWFDYCRELSTWFDAIVFADNSIYDFFSCHTKLFPLVTSLALAIITFLTVFVRKENLCVKEATKSTNFIYIDDKKSRKNRNELNLRCFSSSPTMSYHTFIPQTPNWISYVNFILICGSQWKFYCVLEILKFLYVHMSTSSSKKNK